jgi:hypothetical protein
MRPDVDLIMKIGLMTDRSMQITGWGGSPMLLLAGGAEDGSIVCQSFFDPDSELDWWGTVCPENPSRTLAFVAKALGQPECPAPFLDTPVLEGIFGLIFAEERCQSTCSARLDPFHEPGDACGLRVVCMVDCNGRFAALLRALGAPPRLVLDSDQKPLDEDAPTTVPLRALGDILLAMKRHFPRIDMDTDRLAFLGRADHPRLD